MTTICLGIVLDDMNPARLKCLYDAFHMSMVHELIYAESADDVFAWISSPENIPRGTHLVIVVSYDDFGEVELEKLLKGLEERGLEEATVCGFEKVQRGETMMEELSEYFLEGGPFDPEPNERGLAVQPITGVHATNRQ